MKQGPSERATINLKNSEAFSLAIFDKSAPVGFIATNRGGSQISAHSFCYMPAVAKIDRPFKVARHVDLKVGRVLSLHDRWASEVFAWEADHCPVVLEDTETAGVAVMVLSSGMELQGSHSDPESDGSCWGQLAASWMVGRYTPFRSQAMVRTSRRRI